MSKNKIGWNLDNSYISLPAIFYEKLQPNNLKQPEIILLNKELAGELGLDLKNTDDEKIANYLCGNHFPDGADPIAQSYAGHQFGHFTMLGDGRAMLLGEQIAPSGRRVDIQLKGSGKTRYSRGGDGKATLSAMLREYIMSEAMHGLEIPTTRSLAVITTGETVQRESKEQGAILTRVASSHLRVGTFQFAAAYGSLEDVKALADYAIERHYPKLTDQRNPYLAFLKTVMNRQAALVAKWQLVGFIHGVMNTDNTTISGETIDYGPCAFMDRYHQETVFSSIDLNGRYAYMRQPSIIGWNLARFAEALLPLLDTTKDGALEIAQTTISQFAPVYQENWLTGMRGKLGLFESEKDDELLIDGLLSLMQKHEADFTDTFLDLTFDTARTTKLLETADFKKWKLQWKERQAREGRTAEDILTKMKQHNPAVIPRNQRVEEALEAAVRNNEYHLVKQLVQLMKNPYAHTEEQQSYARLPLEERIDYQTYCGT